MLAPELTRLKENLEAGKQNENINVDRLLAELKDLEKVSYHLYESLSLSQGVCPTCGRRYK